MSDNTLANLAVRLEGLARQKSAKLPKALLKAGLYLQAESQKLVPIDTGALKASAFTTLEGTTDRPEVVVGYTQAYATVVHENLEANHPNGGQAKYLEQPFRTERAAMREIIAQELKK